MSTVNYYQVYCTTDSKWEYVWSDTTPTVCPTNSGHTINSNSISIVKYVADRTVTIKEEDIPTGGHFRVETIVFPLVANETKSINISWPIPVSILSVIMQPQLIQEGDKISVCIAPNTTIGALGASAGTTGTAQDGASTTITLATTASATDDKYNSRTITITGGTGSGQSKTISDYVGSTKVATVSSAWTTNPDNTSTYFIGEKVFTVSSTVLDYIKLGYYVRLFDGTNNNECGRVIGIDKNTSQITVETETTTYFSAATPTYVQMSVYMMKDYEISGSEPYIIGSSKLGASYIPANTISCVTYVNTTAVTKTFRGSVEYLY